MSTAVGLVYKNKVYIGADGRVTTEGSDILPIKMKKVFKNKKYLIGYVGSVRAAQTLLPHSFDPPENVLDFPDLIREHFLEKGCLGKDDEQMDSMTSNYLIGHKGKLYEILIDFQLNEIENFVAVGAGSAYAFGAYYAAKNFIDDPIELLKLTLNAACEYNGLTGPPLQIEML